MNFQEFSLPDDVLFRLLREAYSDDYTRPDRVDRAIADAATEKA